jgi:hypothetical protein
MARKLLYKAGHELLHFKLVVQDCHNIKPVALKVIVRVPASPYAIIALAHSYCYIALGKI